MITDLLQITGTDIVFRGEKLRMRGVSLGNWLLLEHQMFGLPYVDYGIRQGFADVLGAELADEFFRRYEDAYITEADIARIAELGFNFIRLPFRYRLLEDDAKPGQYKARGWELLDRVMKWCRQREIFVLLDMHAAPGAQARDWNADNVTGQCLFWTDASYRQRAAEMWRAIADRYRHEPYLFGYDLLCEPVAWNDAAVQQAYRELIAAVRAVDRHHVITLEPDEWGRDIASLSDDLFNDPQVMPHLHVYMQAHVPWRKMDRYPATVEGQQIDRAAQWEVLQTMYDPARIRRPWLMGELGLTARMYPDFMYDLYRDYMGLLEEHGFHWAWWAYKDAGYFSLLHPRPDSPWLRFTNRRDVTGPVERLSKFCAPLFNPNYNEGRHSETSVLMREMFPDLDNEFIQGQVYEVQRDLQKLALYSALNKLKTYPRDQILEMAGSFALDHCQPEPKNLALVQSFLPRRSATGS